MLKSILILITMGTVAVSAKAQKSDTANYKQVEQTKVSEIINVSADQLWEIIGPGFGNVGVWSRAVDHAEITGDPEFEGAVCSERFCDVNAKGFTNISEKLVEYKDGEKILAYQVYEGMPSFVVFAQNRWEILEAGPGQSRIRMTITMRMKPFMGTIMGGMFRKNLNKTLDGAIEDLKIYAETGVVSEEKRQRIEKLAGV